jgi:hypothetical protein
MTTGAAHISTNICIPSINFRKGIIKLKSGDLLVHVRLNHPNHIISGFSVYHVTRLSLESVLRIDKSCTDSILKFAVWK